MRYALVNPSTREVVGVVAYTGNAPLVVQGVTMIELGDEEAVDVGMVYEPDQDPRFTRHE